MRPHFREYIDLTRLHFFFVWPILFSSGLFLAFQHYERFSWSLLLRVIWIGFLGFEGGFVLNDLVDRELDKNDVEFDKMTKYWRVFRTKPISQGFISTGKAITLFVLLVLLTTALTLTLPFPHSMYVIVIMVYCYCIEYFYQMKKRNQTFPIAQLVGRTDFTLFPVAGYLCVGHPDLNALLFASFFYPLAIAHLGVNDIIDVTNDRVKGMKTIPVLFGMKGTTYWILLFSTIHFGTTVLFLNVLGTVALAGFSVGLCLLSIANFILLKGKSAESGMKALPLFHVAMLIYAISIILDYMI